MHMPKKRRHHHRKQMSTRVKLRLIRGTTIIAALGLTIGLGLTLPRILSSKAPEVNVIKDDNEYMLGLTSEEAESYEAENVEDPLVENSEDTISDNETDLSKEQEIDTTPSESSDDETDVISQETTSPESQSETKTDSTSDVSTNQDSSFQEDTSQSTTSETSTSVSEADSEESNSTSDTTANEEEVAASSGNDAENQYVNDSYVNSLINENRDEIDDSDLATGSSIFNKLDMSYIRSLTSDGLTDDEKEELKTYLHSVLTDEEYNTMIKLINEYAGLVND